MSAGAIPAPLVGRDNELEELTVHLAGARRGGRLAVLEGEAGIGKTRLADAALAAVRGRDVTVLAARADEFESRRSYAAIVELVAASGDAGWGERLDHAKRADAPGPDAGGERQFRVAETLLELLDELCAAAPVVLAVEDVHWADPATLGVLARVATGVESLPAALVVSLRPEPRRRELDRLLALLDERGALSIGLGPLDAQASAELVARLVDARPGPRLLEQAGGAAGNPLFVGQLVAALEAEGAIERRDGVAEVVAADATPPLPVAILHRLSFLPVGELELLGLASVLGTTFRASDLATLAGRPVAELVSALRSALRAGVLAESGDQLVFRHELIRDALYEDMPLSVRRGLHADLGRALAGAGAPPERVAEHVLRGAEPGDEQAVASVLAAARDLAGTGPSVAVDLYRRAIELSPFPDATRAQVAPELAEALVSAGLLAEGLEACREALALGVDDDWALTLRLYLVRVLLRQAEIGEALREGETALAASASMPPGRRKAQLRGWVAIARMFAGDLDGAVREARGVLDEESDELARALAVNALALVSFAQGRYADALAQIEESTRRVEASGSRDGYQMLPHVIQGQTLVCLDRLDDAYAVLQTGRRAMEALGIVDVLSTFHYCLAAIDLARGRLDDALAELAVQLEFAQTAGGGWQLMAESTSALIALLRDDLLAARDHVAAAEREAAAVEVAWGVDLLIVAKARTLEASGAAGEALATVEAGFAGARTAGAPMLYASLGQEFARLAVAAGEPQRAVDAAAAVEELAALNPGVRSLAAAAQRTRGLVDRDADALAAAAYAMGEAGRPLERAAILEEAAAALAPPSDPSGTDPSGGGPHGGAPSGGGPSGGGPSGGDPSGGDPSGSDPSADGRSRAAARELLEEARAVYEAAGATRPLARVEQALRGLGARRGARGPRQRPKEGWEALTDSELKVVRLVAERLTNPEIAERLFVSRRTVQTHVSHSLAKLGVSSRRELAEEAARRAGWRIRVEGGGEQGEQSEPAAEVPRRAVVDDEQA